MYFSQALLKKKNRTVPSAGGYSFRIDNFSYLFYYFFVSPYPDLGILSTVDVFGCCLASFTGMNSPVFASRPSGKVLAPLLVLILLVRLVDNRASVMVK